MRTRKLSSGSWQVTVPIGKDKAGRYRYKSFTDKDKKTAVRKAADYQDQHREFAESVTVGDAITSFLASQDGILSPGTIRGYTSLAKTLKREHAAFCALTDISQKDLQRLINQLSDSHTPKTVRNVHGFLSAVVKHHGNTLPPVNLPQKQKPVIHIPDEQIARRISDAAKGTRLEIPVALAFFALLFIPFWKQKKATPG